MKIFLLAALIVAATCKQLQQLPQLTDRQAQWPWQVGKIYKYSFQSQNLARLEEGASSGSAMTADFILRLTQPGRLQARLENVQHTQIHQELSNGIKLPNDLPYKPQKDLEVTFEISVEGGRVKALNLPASVNHEQENLIKGLVSSIQVDLTPYRNTHSSHNYFNNQNYQGQFRKMEVDVTGDCETQYTVTPLESEWRRMVPVFINDEAPIQVTKTINYSRCRRSASFHFGVPNGYEWNGNTHNHDHQLLKRFTESKIFVGKQGPIYRVKTTSSVYVSPLMHGEQKAKVLSEITLRLVSVEQDNQSTWSMGESQRQVNSLLYSMYPMQNYDASNEDSLETYVEHPQLQQLDRTRRSGKALVDQQSNTNTDNLENYINPQTQDENKNHPMVVQKLTQEIAQQLQNVNNLPKSDILSKFNILVHFIRAMSNEQLSQTSRTIQIGKTSNNHVKSDMWMVYRDAVAQAGTVPAFQQIKMWIQSKKLQGQQAAQTINTLAISFRYPTKELMKQFYQFAQSPEVVQEPYLNTTALLSATRFIRMGHVDNYTVHQYYPTDAFGRYTNKHDRFVLDEIIPNLREQLVNAIQTGDSYKAQIYIKAIGNLGHREIINIFAPYLEGKIVVSTYLRRAMIENLRSLAQLNDHYVRAVLFNIVKNTAEPPEVRIAAIHILFMARVSTQAMQSLALMTRNDPSLQVRAVLKSAIETIAQMKGWEEARNAQVAKDILTKEKFGVYYSSKLYSNVNGADNEYFNVLNYIASENSLFPKYLRYSWNNKMHSKLNHKETVSASFSDVRQFIETLQEQMIIMSQRQRQQQPLNHKYTAEKVAQMLNIKHDAQTPLEASFYYNLLGQERFLTIDESYLQRLPTFFQKTIADLAKGVDMHYFQMTQQAEMKVMLPLATGVSIVYKYKEPTLIHLEGKAKAEIQFPSSQNKDQSSNMDGQIYLTYARNLDGVLGFVDPVTKHYASAGFVNKVQMHLPIKVQLEVRSEKTRLHLEPIRPDQDVTLLHFSVWPYTANYHKDSQVVASLDSATKVISRNHKIVSHDAKFGLPATGIQFQFQGYSYSKDYSNYANLYRGDIMSSFMLASYQKDVALTHFNFRYLGKQSQNKGVTLNAVYNKYYNKQTAAEALKPTTINDVTPDSESRRQELLNRVASGIKSAKVNILDLSATFQGVQKSEYILTGAVGNSQVDNRVQYAVFVGRNNAKLGNYQINAVSSVSKFESSSLNFIDAIQKNLKSNFNVDVRFGQDASSRVTIDGSMERSIQQGEVLKQSPLGQQCVKEMDLGNNYQSACRKAIMIVNAPSSVKASVSYKDVTPTYKNNFYQVYRWLRHFGFWYSEENILKNNADGKMDVQFDFLYLQQIFNVHLNSRYGELRFKNVPLPKGVSDMFAANHLTNFYESFVNYYSRQQYLPHCVVDGSRISTFSNRSFDYALSRSWHVVMQDNGAYAGKRDYNQDQLLVLARRLNEKQQEIYISYRSPNGEDVEIEMKPQANNKPILNVNTKTKKISEGDHTIYLSEERDVPLLQYYYQANNVVMMNIENGFRAMYDGQRFVVYAQNNRNNTRGLCGYMNGEIHDDFLTPFGVVDQPNLYAASFALNQENPDPQTTQLQEQAKKVAYQRRYVYTTMLWADNEWQNWHSGEGSSSSEEHSHHTEVYRVRNYNKQQECILAEQIQYYENHGEICITTTALPSCSSNCHGQDYLVRSVQVVCRPKLDEQFRMYRDQIRRGENPKVNGVSQYKQFRVPKQCQA